MNAQEKCLESETSCIRRRFLVGHNSPDRFRGLANFVLRMGFIRLLTAEQKELLRLVSISNDPFLQIWSPPIYSDLRRHFAGGFRLTSWVEQFLKETILCEQTPPLDPIRSVIWTEERYLGGSPRRTLNIQSESRAFSHEITENAYWVFDQMAANSKASVCRYVLPDEMRPQGCGSLFVQQFSCNYGQRDQRVLDCLCLVEAVFDAEAHARMGSAKIAEELQAVDVTDRREFTYPELAANGPPADWKTLLPSPD